MATRGKGPTKPKKKSETVARRDVKPFQAQKRVNPTFSKKAFRGIQKH